MLPEDVEHETGIEVHPDYILDGRLYRLVFVPGSLDYETGYIDEWTYRFELMKDDSWNRKE